MMTNLPTMLASVLSRILQRELALKTTANLLWSDRALKVACLQLAEELEVFANTLKD